MTKPASARASRKASTPPPATDQDTLGTYKLVAVTSIQIETGFNVREADPESFQRNLRELAEDIKTNGLQNPLVVEQVADAYVVRGGHRRLTAIRLANQELEAAIEKVPVIVRNDMTDLDRLRLQAADQYSEPLGPLALAELAKRLMAHGMTQSQVAQEFKISVAYAGDLRRLAEAPDEVKDAVREDEISATLATELVKEEGAEAAVEIIEEAKREIEASSPPPALTPPEGGEEAPKPEGDKAPKKGNQRRSITRRTVEKVKAKLGRAPASSRQPSTRRIPAPAPAPSEETPSPRQAISPMRMISRFVDTADALLAAFRAGQPYDKQIVDMAWLVRECAIHDFVSKGLAGITATTPDATIAAFADRTTDTPTEGKEAA